MQKSATIKCQAEGDAELKALVADADAHSKAEAKRAAQSAEQLGSGVQPLGRVAG